MSNVPVVHPNIGGAGGRDNRTCNILNQHELSSSLVEPLKLSSASTTRGLYSDMMVDQVSPIGYATTFFVGLLPWQSLPAPQSSQGIADTWAHLG